MEENETLLSKYFTSQSQEKMRSEIKFADYNPRIIDQEARKSIKRGIKKYGMVGGITVNKQTGNTIVGGHQRVSVIDELQKYDPETNENDYKLRVDVIDVSETEEKELNILLNNPNAQGRWDYDRLRDLVSDIDYKNAALTEADLSMIGLDSMFKSDGEDNLANELEELMSGVNELHRQEVEERKAEREELKERQKKEKTVLDEPSYEDKVAAMKEVKAQVKGMAAEKAADMEAYLMLSFDNWDNKAAFCQRLGLDPYSKFCKGEHIDGMVEVIREEDYEE